jgi:hypothetical protein
MPFVELNVGLDVCPPLLTYIIAVRVDKPDDHELFKKMDTDRKGNAVPLYDCHL